MSSLTLQELAVLRGYANGLTTGEVADELGIKYNTVRTHTGNILRKLHTRRITGAVAIGLRAGWIK